MDYNAAFDHSGRVPPPPLSALAAELWALSSWRPAAPRPADLPHGRGCGILVIPAFLTGDAFTASLRHFLDRCGFRCFGWGLGINWGPTPAILAGLRRGLHGARQETGAPVALLGYSLGGLLARHLAQTEPDLIGHVATLGSPARLPTASPLAPLFRALLPFYAAELDPLRLTAPLPMPVTAIWTRQDGIVAPETCLPPEASGSFEVSGRHATLARNPEALALLVRRRVPA